MLNVADAVAPSAVQQSVWLFDESSFPSGTQKKETGFVEVFTAVRL
jgi:hypothetical protein